MTIATGTVALHRGWPEGLSSALGERIVPEVA